MFLGIIVTVRRVIATEPPKTALLVMILPVDNRYPFACFNRLAMSSYSPFPFTFSPFPLKSVCHIAGEGRSTGYSGNYRKDRNLQCKLMGATRLYVTLSNSNLEVS